MKTRLSLTRALAALRGAKAPPTLAPAVYDRLGLYDRYVRMPTEIGEVYVAYGKDGVVAVGRAPSDAAYERRHARNFARPAKRVAEPDAALLDKLRRTFAGKKTGRIRIDLRGLSAFQQAVLQKTREIPRGEVRPYAWVAKAIGRPQAVRAVGSALAKNPVPLLIPCHRVVRSDGTVGSYIFGNPAKRALLAFEHALGA